jgi:5-methylcytosine-specific restriction endonuclease McrA
MGGFERANSMRTLVLNAGYEPLGVVSFKRALTLVMNNKATVIEQSETMVHSARQDFDLPSVILLTRYVRVPISHSIPVTRRGILRRDNHHCAYCGRAANTIDHVFPKSRGGADSWENLVACCLKCNNTKSDKTLADLGWSLRFTPKMPTGGIWTVRGAERIEETWDNYLIAA